MTEAMKITLSTQPADARWGEKATYSINNDGITLHLNGAAIGADPACGAQD